MPQTINNKIVTEEQETRASLLKKLGEYLEAEVISFYALQYHWKSSLMDSDVVMLQDIVASVGKAKRLLLVINSPGGDPLAAEKMIKVFREWSEDSFETLITDKAKSAATMVCFGSDKIFMTPASELGPIDLQVEWGPGRLPAHVVIKSYEELMDKCSNTPPNQRVEPFLQQLQAYNAAQIEELRLLRDLSKSMAEKVLKTGMLKGREDCDLEEILMQFLNPEALKSHGRPIFFSDIQELDKNKILNVECIGIDNPIFKTIHEYDHRVKNFMLKNRLAKLCETKDDMFLLSIDD